MTDIPANAVVIPQPTARPPGYVWSQNRCGWSNGVEECYEPAAYRIWSSLIPEDILALACDYHAHEARPMLTAIETWDPNEHPAEDFSIHRPTPLPLGEVLAQARLRRKGSSHPSRRAADETTDDHGSYAFAL